MFYGDNVQDTRQIFYSSWLHYRKRQSLLPLEKQVVDVILMHPEYHAMLDAPQDQPLSFFPELGETNPFLHMGLHLAILDQVATDRPAGIAAVYKQLLMKHGDASLVEHLMMEHLAECLWTAQSNHSIPDEKSYLMACRQLIEKS